MTDALSVLREAGLPVDQLSAAQREVLAGLTEQETRVLAAVQRRLAQAVEEVEAEVGAHDLKLL
jgi:hypothetical protein